MLTQNALISPLSIAPMIDWTYTHFRVLMRLLAPQALLYTEMITLGAIQHNGVRELAFSPIEQPLALQLGGTDIDLLIKSAKQAEDLGFAEVNINLGCPSDRVQAGRFGACLMKEPEQVAAGIHAMKQAVKIPVTAKTRIGIDHDDSYEFFHDFCAALIAAGADKLIIHARKAWLSGLSPKQNRSIPPINYDYAYRLKAAFPEVPLVINGNINTIEEVQSHLQRVDGVMLGRLACNDPYMIATIHQALSQHTTRSRREILQDYLYYAEEMIALNVPFSLLIKPILNMAHSLPDAKHWKAHLIAVQQKKDLAAFKQSLNYFPTMGKMVNWRTVTTDHL